MAQGKRAGQGNLAALAVLLGLLGCGDPAKKTEPKDANAAVDGSPDGTTEADGGQPDVAVDSGAGSDASDIAEDLGPGDVGTDASDAVDASQCATATDCKDLTLSPCQQAACEGGTCKAVAKADTCCSDSDCDDKVECTADKCDTGLHACLHSLIVNCCSGKVTLLKTGIEQGFEADFKDTPGPTNGNVHWQASTARAHSGKASLYFGNECHTYDNTQTGDDGCKAGGEATAVSTSLQTKEYVLPKDKKAQLHFWLWLDTEPSYATTLPVGTCKNPCPTGSTCALVAGSSQCLPEKDVLQVNLLTGAKVLPVFNSTSIGKTTKGGWQHIAIDLSEHAGEPVKLQWAFNTGTGLKNGFEGVYLDDIVVETICATSGAVCDAKTPCPEDGNACTLDACTGYSNATTAGVCFFDKKPGCCTTASDCDDGNSCTLDTCVSGQCQQAPDASQPGCCKSSILQVDDFDSGTLDAWTMLNLNSNSVKWRVDAKGGTGSSASLFFGTEALTGYDDPSLGKDTGPKGTICTKTFTLKAGTVYDQVTFDLRMESEWSGQPKGSYKNPPIAGKAKFDVLTVQVYSDGKFSDAWSSDAIQGTTDDKYLTITAGLDAWQGKDVQVCLTFDAGDGQQNGFGGVHVDNFAVKAACSKKPCYFDNECSGLTCGDCQAATCGASGCGCEKITGCCKVDADCTDGDDVCTTDSCGADGTCVFSKTGAEGCAP